MPSSIPYNHPSLVLGNLVDTRVLGLLKQIDTCNQVVDAAQDKLNSYVLMKRSLSMTINEIADMGVDLTSGPGSALLTKQSDIDKSMITAATEYVDKRVDNETKIQALREQLSALQIQESVESPLDLKASKLLSLPLATDSIKMDSQYFSFDTNMQDDVMSNIEKFVRDNTQSQGGQSKTIAEAVSRQVSNQTKNHSVAGTLIIAASCTYADVRVFDPVVVDPDKAVSAWNTLNDDKIQVDALKSTDGSEGEPQRGTGTISVITGASYGSSFIGMVHILNSETTNSADIESIKSDLSRKLQIGGWLENAIGGYGVSADALNDVKAILDTRKITSHISLVVTGALPSIASGKLLQGVRQLKQDTSTISDSPSAIGSFSSEAEKAREFGRALSAERARMQSIMSNLSTIDLEANKSFGLSSLIDAFENYLSDKDPERGVPVSFFLKKLTKSEIENLWKTKYFPLDKDQKNDKTQKPDK